MGDRQSYRQNCSTYCVGAVSSADRALGLDCRDLERPTLEGTGDERAHSPNRVAQLAPAVVGVSRLPVGVVRSGLTSVDSYVDAVRGSPKGLQPTVEGLRGVRAVLQTSDGTFG